VPSHSVSRSISTLVGPTCRPRFAPSRACLCRLASYASPLVPRRSRPLVTLVPAILGLLQKVRNPRYRYHHTLNPVRDVTSATHLGLGPRGTTYFFQDCFPFRASCLLISCFTSDRLASVIIPPSMIFSSSVALPFVATSCLLLSGLQQEQGSLRLAIYVTDCDCSPAMGS
jgi:hypothetical protein